MTKHLQKLLKIKFFFIEGELTFKQFLSLVVVLIVGIVVTIVISTISFNIDDGKAKVSKQILEIKTNTVNIK